MAEQTSEKSTLERTQELARQQLGLDDTWKIAMMANSVPAGLDEQIDDLGFDGDLDDGERWRRLEAEEAPIAQLPAGLQLVTLVKRQDRKTLKTAGFVRID